MEASKIEALKVMESANRIIEDFSVGQFAVYVSLFLVEVALCFWIALHM